jgi:hypothetical protein
MYHDESYRILVSVAWRILCCRAMTIFLTSSFYCPEYNAERGSYFGNPKELMGKVAPPITSAPTDVGYLDIANIVSCKSHITRR